ncbi:hypothetical protein [Synechococcus sp. PCC 6312]|uniref:hypothetical protein n=1 Tax=Synechococcus sp. (strain ATCC 27167 / PCC 6312) TaxID=195253 RepID=UPI00029F3432|nr:hypothetical protein [Synechococcus sp. PCC 6312]AFY62801.1 hypothetical protein Syn6312_3791 [Synechococcus sp. PCC 6312]
MIDIPNDGGDFQLITIPYIGKLPRQWSIRVETVEQWAVYHDIRSHFTDIGLGLKAYFSGSPKPKFADQLLIEKELDYYLSLYNLIWFGWEQIEAGLEDRQLRFGTLLCLVDENTLWGTESGLVEPLPDSPGGMLRLILKWECIEKFEPYLTKRVVNTNAITGLNLKESSKILRGNLGQEPLEGFSSKSAQAKARYTRLYAQDALNRSGCQHFVTFLEQCIQKRCRGNNTLRRKLKQFQVVRQQKVKTIAKLANASLQKSSKTI